MFQAIILSNLKGKLINQTWENDKKLNFRPDFGPFGPNLGAPKFCSCVLALLGLRHVANYHRVQFQGKLMIQTQKNGKKNSFWTWFSPVRPKFGQPKFFLKNLALPVTKYHGQLSSCTILEKTNDPILKKFCDGQTNKRRGPKIYDFHSYQ